MLAIRIARVATNRKWIIKIGGSYHGWSDQLVYDMHVPGTKLLESHGIPKNVFKFTDSCPPNDIETLRQMFKEKRKVAAVLIEPMGGESGANPVRPGFNKEVEELCHENKALLISDEVVCAFRLHMGGGQAYYGYDPDLSVFGKIVGHGYPSAAAIGGKEEYMKFCAAGVGGGKRAYSGGTLAANPLTCAAAYHAIKLVEETNATEIAGKAGARLANGLNQVFEKYENLPWFAYNLGGTVHFHTSCLFGLSFDIPEQVGQLPLRKKFMEHIGAALVDQEIISVAGSRFYMCILHTDEIIDQTVYKIDKICQQIE
jgi:glutamate-1-semialdehyde 2,1-aminomutase